MSECISKQNVNIASVDIKVKESIGVAHFIVQVNNNRQLNRLMRKMTKLKYVDYVLFNDFYNERIFEKEKSQNSTSRR